VVQAQADPARPATVDVCDQRRPLHAGGTDDDPRHAGFEELTRVSQAADAASGLYGGTRRAKLACYLGYHRPVRPLTGPSGVEVDHVNPPGSSRREPDGDSHRVVAVDGLCGEVPFE
jgi:hypothetical protein